MELYHHGIKDMHWGIRRFQNEDGSLTPLGKIRYGAPKVAKKVGTAVTNAYKKHSEKKAEAKKLNHPKTAANMPDDELKSRLSRLQMEKQYNSLMKELHPTKKNLAAKLVSDSIEKLGNAAANTLVNYGTEKIKNAIFPTEVQKTLSDLTGIDLDKLSKKQLTEYSDMIGLKNRILGIDDSKNSNNNNQQDSFTKTLAELEKMDIKKMSKKELNAYKDMKNTAESLRSKDKVENSLKYYMNADISKMTPSEAKAAVEFINNVNVINKFRDKGNAEDKKQKR